MTSQSPPPSVVPNAPVPGVSDAPVVEKPPAFSVSASAVIAGAFAAVTSALVGSQLGVAGTLVGAAVGSAVGAFATAVYTWSIQRTVHVIKHIKPSGASGASKPESVAEVTVASASGASRARDRTWLRSSWAKWTAGALATTLLAFAISLVVITGIEKATGRSLSGGGGTTIQQVGRSTNGGGATDSTPRPSATGTPAPSASRSSAAPSHSATPGPASASGQSTATAQPSVRPSTTASTSQGGQPSGQASAGQAVVSARPTTGS